MSWTANISSFFTLGQQADSRFCDGNSKMCTNGICSFDNELDTTDGKSTHSVDIEVLFINKRKKNDLPLSSSKKTSLSAISNDIKFYLFVFEF